MKETLLSVSVTMPAVKELVFPFVIESDTVYNTPGISYNRIAASTVIGLSSSEQSNQSQLNQLLLSTWYGGYLMVHDMTLNQILALLKIKSIVSGCFVKNGGGLVALGFGNGSVKFTNVS